MIGRRSSRKEVQPEARCVSMLAAECHLNLSEKESQPMIKKKEEKQTNMLEQDGSI